MTRRHPKVALLIETSNAYARGLLAGVVRYIHENARWNFALMERSRQQNPPQWLAHWDGDGIIARIESPSIARAILDSKLPAVDVSGARYLPKLPWVETDDRAIARLAAEHFLERGFKSFGYCGDGRFSWSEGRNRLFNEFIRAAGHICDAFVPPEESGDRQVMAIGQWLKGLPKPVGIFACYDIRGQQVLAACEELGLVVPDEVAVLGVDNDELLCELASPPLSSVIPDSHRAGFEAARILDRMMKGKKVAPLEVRIPPLGVHRRQSTDALAISDPKVVAAVRYIREHACDGIDVSDVLRAVPMSRRILERRFQQLLQRTLHDEIIRVRMDRVKQLLADTDLPLEAIAVRTGYVHFEYLSVTFKRETGVTPRDYRMERRAHAARPRRLGG